MNHVCVAARTDGSREGGRGSYRGGCDSLAAGIGATRSRGPLAGCDRWADRGRVPMAPIRCASPGSDPRGNPLPPCDAPFAGAAAEAPYQCCSNTPLCAPSRTTLRETEAGAHEQAARQRVPRRAEQVPAASSLDATPKRDRGALPHAGHLRAYAVASPQAGPLLHAAAHPPLWLQPFGLARFWPMTLSLTL
jgi:hypothetical protein